MKKLIILFYTVMVSIFNVYSNSELIEYTIDDKQYNTIIIKTPATISVEKGSGYCVNITNESNNRYDYEIINDSLVIKPKYKIVQTDLDNMKPELLKIKLVHPNPDNLMENIKVGSWLDLQKHKNKSGNQN